MNTSNINFIKINPFLEFNRVKKIWIDLQNQSQHSFFNSWGWISVWLQTLPHNTNIDFILVEQHDKPVVCFFLGIKKGFKHKIIYANRAYLNSTGIPLYDELVIEYNSITGDINQISPDILFNNPLFKPIDEFILPHISSHLHTELISKEKLNHSWLTQETEQRSFYVDLDIVRSHDNNYLSLLSKNKRFQIKQSIRAYEKEFGTIKLEVSKNKTQAIQMLDELEKLHQSEWKKRAKTGAFSCSFFKNFHIQLIKERFDFNEIQLIKIATQQHTLGYLYNFVYNKNVLFYQSGFNYLKDNHYRPGLVSHYLAILHNTLENNLSYDFLAGDSTYKKSLSTSSNLMYDIKLKRKKLRFYIENLLKQLKLNKRQ